MKALLIEDEAPAARRLQQLLASTAPDLEVLAVMDSIESACNWFAQNAMPELIFMDIQLADGLSFEIFDQVKIQAPVIFTTAYDEYTLRAFKVNSIDYLLKPISQEELSQSLAKLRQWKSQFQGNTTPDIEGLLKSLQIDKKEYKSRFLVKLGDRLISVCEDQIAYFYAEQKIVILVTQDQKKYAVDYSLDELENLLNPGHFFRLNRQFIARIQSIQSIHQYFKSKLKVILAPEAPQEVIVSRERSPIFKKWLDQ